mgnify:CR=1 FL=1
MTFYYLVPAQTLGRIKGETHLQYWQRKLFRGKKLRPVGGVKIIYQHCEMLNQAGFHAVPVHLSDFSVDWFPHQLEPLSAQAALERMTNDDVLICPEVIPAAAALFPCATKIAFVQNWALADFGTGPDKRFEDFGFTGLLTCSTYLQDYMANKSDLPCDLVVNGIDHEVFQPHYRQAEKNSVMILSRKNMADASAALDLLDAQTRKKAEVIVLESKYTQTEMAGFYRQADIFLAIGYPEGFALPPLEAMACGCAVTGFTGGGGLEHMIEGQTALIAADGDIQGLAAGLARLLNEPELKERLRAHGQKKAAEFSLAQMQAQLLDFATRIAKKRLAA